MGMLQSLFSSSPSSKTNFGNRSAQVSRITNHQKLAMFQFETVLDIKKKDEQIQDPTFDIQSFIKLPDYEFILREIEFERETFRFPPINWKKGIIPCVDIDWLNSGEVIYRSSKWISGRYLKVIFSIIGEGEGPVLDHMLDANWSLLPQFTPEERLKKSWIRIVVDDILRAGVRSAGIARGDDILPFIQMWCKDVIGAFDPLDFSSSIQKGKIGRLLMEGLRLVYIPKREKEKGEEEDEEIKIEEIEEEDDVYDEEEKARRKAIENEKKTSILISLPGVPIQHIDLEHQQDRDEFILLTTDSNTRKQLNDIANPKVGKARRIDI